MFTTPIGAPIYIWPKRGNTPCSATDFQVMKTKEETIKGNTFCVSELTKLKKKIYQAAIAIKISNLLICFCSFDLSCPILEKYSFFENVYIVLSCFIKERDVAPW